MGEITTLFWDVGGVLLTNGWDTSARRRAAEKFDLDWDTFESRHELVSYDFETGRVSLEEYLDASVFHREHAFDRETFRDFMLRQSRPNERTLELVESLSATKKYLMATINNESLELNLYRIQRFGFRDLFTVFFSSCFLGVRKPQREIYETTLRVTQKEPAECLYIDDRPPNLEPARGLGIRTIHFESSSQLREELKRAGVSVD